MGNLIQDVRYGVRMLIRNPGFTAVAGLALALGIGANTAVFSVVNGILLRPLPYKDPGRLVWITESIKELKAELVGGPDYLDWRDQAQTLGGIAAFEVAAGGEGSPSAQGGGYNLTGRGEPQRVQGARVSANFFRVLGVQPQLGRVFTEDEDRPGSNHVVVLTFGLWQGSYGSEPSILGQTLVLDGENYTVVGIMPASFRFPQNPDVGVLLPIALNVVQERARMRMSIVDVIGRLKPGVTLPEARAELQLIMKRALSAPRELPAEPPQQPERDVFIPGPASPGSAPPSPTGTGTLNAPVPAGPALARTLMTRPYGAGPAPGRGPASMQQTPSGGPSRVGGELGKFNARVPAPAPPRRMMPMPIPQVKVVPLQEKLVGNVRPALLVLLGAVAFVLLIACANVANLLLARGTARSKEISIRAALGAGRWRLARQLLTESVLLSCGGGLLGLLLAFWGVSLIVAFTPGRLAGEVFRQVSIGIDGWVLAFTLSLSILTGILFGLVPAFAAAKLDLNESLKEGGRMSGVGVRRSLARSAFVVSEQALALVLLIGAGLLMRSFYRLLNVDPGFQPDKVLTMAVTLPPAQYPQAAQKSAFFEELLRRIQALPAIEHAGLCDSLPLTTFSMMMLGLQVEGQPLPPLGKSPVVSIIKVTPDYFHAIGMRLLEGRQFSGSDAPSALKVAIINQTMANHYWPNGDALGKHFRFGPSAWVTVVGKVADVRHNGLEADLNPEVYLPMAQGDHLGFAYVAIRVAGDPMSLATAARRAVSSLDKNLPVAGLETMTERLAGSVGSRRFNMLLLLTFASLALVLAAVGIYGVMSHSVTQRTHEIGVRMALGAARDDVLKLVVRQGMALAFAGVLAGLGVAVALTRLMSSLLYGISSRDPVTFVVVSLVLMAVAFVASYLPARRATKVDPVVALRYE